MQASMKVTFVNTCYGVPVVILPRTPYTKVADVLNTKFHGGTGHIGKMTKGVQGSREVDIDHASYTITHATVHDNGTIER